MQTVHVHMCTCTLQGFLQDFGIVLGFLSVGLKVTQKFDKISSTGILSHFIKHSKGIFLIITFSDTNTRSL